MTTVPLEATQEQLDAIGHSTHVAIVQYEDNETGDVLRAWVDCVGTEEECREAVDRKLHGIYIVPPGVGITAFIKTTAELVPPKNTMEDNDAAATP